MSISKHVPRGLVFGAALLFATGCATTTVDDESIDASTPPDSGVFVDPGAPVATDAVVGSAAELLPEIGIDLSRLSAQIADEGDQDATLARIEANWAAIEGEVERERPELVPGIQATIDMARTAVERKRPADADKAFKILRELIDAFTGDS